MKKILIIDDEEILAQVLKDRFQSRGWHVTVAGDGEKALDRVWHEVFDLVLLDLLLPEKSGLDVLRGIRDPGAPHRLHQIPVIVLSDLGDDEDIQQAMKIGATDCFVKTQHPIGEILDRADALYQTAISKTA